MLRQPSSWIFAAMGLTAIWSGVMAVYAYTEQYVSTPEKVMELMDKAPWRTKGAMVDSGTRRLHLEKVVQSAAKLTSGQRLSFRSKHQEDVALFYMELTEAERQWMAEKTVEPFYKVVSKAFNVMSRLDREKIINSARKQMRAYGTDMGGMERISEREPAFWQRLAQEGIGDTYEKATPEEKLMLAPLLEELQRRVQSPRR